VQMNTNIVVQFRHVMEGALLLTAVNYKRREI